MGGDMEMMMDSIIMKDENNVRIVSTLKAIKKAGHCYRPITPSKRIHTCDSGTLFLIGERLFVAMSRSSSTVGMITFIANMLFLLFDDVAFVTP